MPLTFSFKGARERIPADDVDGRITGETLARALHIRAALRYVTCPLHNEEPRSVHFALGAGSEHASAVAECGSDGECSALDAEINRLVREP